MIQVKLGTGEEKTFKKLLTDNGYDFEWNDGDDAVEIANEPKIEHLTKIGEFSTDDSSKAI
jgi:hypothetical protein